MGPEMFRIPSARGDADLCCYAWVPEKVECTLQIVHGMLEYIPRYQDFAEFMNSHGVAVYGDDHLGHGRTTPDTPGFFADEDGDIVLMEDEHRVFEHVCERHPDVPHFVMGHSMGSYITRRYITRYSEGLSGAVLVATGNRSKEDADSKYEMAASVCRESGPHAYDESLDEMVLGKGFSRVMSGGPDLSSLPPERRNRLRFQAGGYRDMFMLTRRLAYEEGFDGIRKDLPLLFLSGSRDPVGDFGKGVLDAARILEGYGLTPEVKIYDGMMHDIVKDEGCGQVWSDILAWIRRNRDRTRMRTVPPILSYIVY